MSDPIGLAPTARGVPGVQRTVTLSCIVVALAFAFGYALVPIYEVFCEWTGIRVNGDTPALVSTTEGADFSRQLTIEFDANVRGDLPWEFHSRNFRVQAHPGAFNEAMFVVVNRSDRPTAGRAIPSIAPPRASPYFQKTECFCFVNQALGPGETREMAVRFVVDPALPDEVSTLTLSYSFFAQELPDAPLAGRDASVIEEAL